MAIKSFYDHPWYGPSSTSNEVPPTKENVKAHLKKVIGYSRDQLDPAELLLDIGKTAYYKQGEFVNIIMKALFKGCSDEDLKYILSVTREERDNDKIEELGLYWEDLVD